MRYLLLIYSAPDSAREGSEAERDVLFQEYLTVTDEMIKRDVRESGEPLEPAHTATTLRIRGGKTLLTDGPFAETSEPLAGYYILNCKNLDEALEFAGKIPGARAGAVEIRPIREIRLPP